MTNLEKLRAITNKMSAHGERDILNEFLLGYLSNTVCQETWDRALEAGVEYTKYHKQQLEDFKAEQAQSAIAPY